MKTIEQALDEAYKNAGSNAYFGNGFKAGVEFSQRWIKFNDKKPELGEEVLLKYGGTRSSHIVVTLLSEENYKLWRSMSGNDYFKTEGTEWRQIEIK